MKKIIISAVACAAIAQAGMFVGFDGGYAMNSFAGDGSTKYGIYYDGTLNKPKNNARFDANAWNVALNFGAEGFVNGYFGARAFIEALYSGGLDSAHSHFDLLGNADLIVNFVSNGGIGAFVGFGVGYSYWWGSGFGQGNAPLYARTGLTFGIGKNSRIDATLKIPVVGWYAHGDDKITKQVYQPFSIQLGYKYLF